jgi:hypothetical protein
MKIQNAEYRYKEFIDKGKDYRHQLTQALKKRKQICGEKAQLNDRNSRVESSGTRAESIRSRIVKGSEVQSHVCVQFMSVLVIRDFVSPLH